MCSSAGRAAVSKAAGRGFESLRTRSKRVIKDSRGENVVVEVKTMEPKKNQQAVLHSPKEKEAVSSAKKLQAADFVGEVKAELKRISWTSPEELKTYTKIVVGATFVCGMGIYFMDLLIQASLWVLESALRWIV